MALKEWEQKIVRAKSLDPEWYRRLVAAKNDELMAIHSGMLTEEIEFKVKRILNEKLHN